MKTVKISEDFYNDVKIHASVKGRSIPKQIEYWGKIGKLALENPDLPVSFIQDILISRAEQLNGEVMDFEFSD